MNEDQSSFGKQLRRLRKWKGKSQAEVARELTTDYPGFTISQTNISHLERRIEAPREEVLSVLADYYGVPIEFFFKDTSDSYEDLKPRIEEFLDSLAVRANEASGILLHTDDNSSEDVETLDTTNNIRNWYSGTGVSED